jgi:hypothetical protein
VGEPYVDITSYVTTCTLDIICGKYLLWRLLLHCISVTNKIYWVKKWIYKIWGFHGGDYDECRLLGYKNRAHTSQETNYIWATEPSRLMPCKIWGFHCGDYEESRLLACDPAWLFKNLRLRGAYRLHHQDFKNLRARNVSSNLYPKHAAKKCCSKLHLSAVFFGC